MKYLLYKNHHNVLITTERKDIEEFFRQKFKSNYRIVDTNKEIKRCMRKLFKDNLPHYKIYKI